MGRKNYWLVSVGIVLVSLFLPENAYAMHIAEGFLPAKWAGIWWVLMLPFLTLGIKHVKRVVDEHDPSIKMLLALAGAFIFVLSSLKLPSVTGSTSHPTGIGLGAILFGPWPMVVLGCIVLIFQAVLLAHGGLTTLGANVFSMAIVGPFVAYGIYKLFRKLGAPLWLTVFLAAALGNLLTYVMTAIQLSLAFPAETGGFIASLTKFMGVFAITQVPLAITEGLVTVLIFNLLREYSKGELKKLSIIS
ncbi:MULTISPECIES: energy-coupling factor ABC transporter permease [unclassified Candidatus Frackibacter]|uniref:energy-coupling factor ABC transporter permease n=1 Tax=unclassified Candidatus Frackibacter TaxID=2648818 RepID=UPI000799D388|nr:MULTISPECIES: energy-coupling factor ABC transporter permease [unclassified Candidatus Frackibacter]KXS37477.1 MAG: cobalt/nickel transport system permease protein [Candidatus Frackibacter sp. T328-2]SDC34448.1 cobalt/nickel transport system permease protein [Candidatus Frackibacter sp. WG11]SEM56825.1 cobalt/nickel transport system permease protein [Candidatus Frackibacter sp. WG12]SFL70460.1 cobalt/nickel transport system permease protein [Candidatus Frackibacter sp. WG13]